MTERGEAGQKSEGAGQKWQAMEPRVGVETEEEEAVQIWSYTLSCG